MAAARESEIAWGRVTAVVGGIVVAYGLLRGISRTVRIAVNEVMYRHGGAGAWGQPKRRS